MPTNVELTASFFLQVAVVLVACRLAGLALARLGQPQVIADMVAGFLLGPLLLGLVAPGAAETIFPAQATSRSILYVVGQLGLVLYMFVVGLSFDTRILRDHVRGSVATGAVSLFVPLVFGGGLGLLLLRAGWFPEGVSDWQAVLFAGTAIAVSAFPVLARIVHERGLTRTRAGTISLACASFDDVAAWTLLAVLVASTRSDPTVVALALAGGVGYTVLMLLGVRPALGRLARWATVGDTIRPAAWPIVAAVLFASAAATEAAGNFAVFGAFLCGVAMPRGQLGEQLRDRLEPVTVHVLLPLFFVYAGLQARPDVLLSPAVLAMFGLVTLVAFVSKGGACAVASRLCGASWSDALSVGALMNARGLVELALLNIGLAAGLITVRFYTVFALMTVVTTLAAVPAQRLAQRLDRTPPAQAAASAARSTFPLSVRGRAAQGRSRAGTR